MWPGLRRRRAIDRFVSESDAALASYYRAPPSIEPSRPWREGRYLVLDFETTAVDPGDGHLLSVGWIAVDHGAVVVDSARHRLVQPPPEVGVEASATVHLLTDTEVSNGGEPAHVVSELFDNLIGRILVCHFAQLEIGYLDQLCRQYWQIGFWPWQLVDTLQWHVERDRTANRVGPGRRLQLNSLMDAYGLPPTKPHNALSDAFGTALLLLALAESTDGTIIGNLLDQRSVL